MSGGEETARLLSRVSLFKGLSDRDLRELAQVAVPRSWLAGQAVFQEGDPGDTCYVIRSGCMRVTRRHSDGRQITLDSSELGYGVPTISGVKNNHEWTVPVTAADGYKPGEIVTYYCRIHPSMRGAFKVVQ